jgi:hypothetical protein
MCRRVRRYDSASQEMLQVLQKCMECQGDNGRAFWQATVARICAGIWARPRHIAHRANWAYPCLHLCAVNGLAPSTTSATGLNGLTPATAAVGRNGLTPCLIGGALFCFVARRVGVHAL